MPEEFFGWNTLLERSRISEKGYLAQRSVIRGDSYMARQWAAQAAHDARLLFPDAFLWQEERYGQQLPLEAA